GRRKAGDRRSGTRARGCVEGGRSQAGKGNELGSGHEPACRKEDGDRARLEDREERALPHGFREPRSETARAAAREAFSRAGGAADQGGSPEGTGRAAPGEVGREGTPGASSGGRPRRTAHRDEQARGAAPSGTARGVATAGRAAAPGGTAASGSQATRASSAAGTSSAAGAGQGAEEGEGIDQRGRRRFSRCPRAARPRPGSGPRRDGSSGRGSPRP